MAVSLADVMAAIQNGVVATNDLDFTVVGSATDFGLLTTTGAPNAYTVTTTVNASALTTGMVFFMKASFTNTSSQPTLDFIVST